MQFQRWLKAIKNCYLTKKFFLFVLLFFFLQKVHLLDEVWTPFLCNMMINVYF